MYVAVDFFEPVLLELFRNIEISVCGMCASVRHSFAFAQ